MSDEEGNRAVTQMEAIAVSRDWNIPYLETRHVATAIRMSNADA
jgi:hypothetical protein